MPSIFNWKSGSPRKRKSSRKLRSNVPDSDELSDRDVNIGASTSKDIDADTFTGLEQRK